MSTFSDKTFTLVTDSLVSTYLKETYKNAREQILLLVCKHTHISENLF